MDESVSAAEANRKFSLLLRGVREGQSYVVTSHGKPVARLVPADENLKARDHARTTLLARLREQPILQTARWTREELYENRS